MIPASTLKGNAKRTRKALRKFGIEPDLQFNISRRPWNYYSDSTIYIHPHCVDNLDIYLHEAGHWFTDYFEVVERGDFVRRFGDTFGYPTYAFRWVKNWLGVHDGFDPDKHISSYAAIAPEEDWCECFSAVLLGEDPDDYPRTIRSKLRYVQKRIKAERD